MTSEREAYIYIQLPGALETVPAALLRMLWPLRQHLQPAFASGPLWVVRASGGRGD